MPYSTQDLSQMFGKAVQSLESNRQALNDLDGPNGNHGDNMVHNLKVVQQTLQAHSGRSPAEALSQAAQTLSGEGRGSASQHYAEGLRQAAAQLQGKQSLGSNDVAGLVQTLLGAVPATQAPFGGGSGSGQAPSGGGHQPHVKPPIGANPSSNQAGDLFSGGAPQQGQGGLSDLLGAMTGGAQGAPNLGGNQAGGSLLDLLGMAAGGGAQQAPSSGGGGLDLGTVLNAGMAFMQAEQSGASTGEAALQALQAGLSGRNPLQSGSPRGASGGLIAQSILGMLTGR